jgi:hypothetical protein
MNRGSTPFLIGRTGLPEHSPKRERKLPDNPKIIERLDQNEDGSGSPQYPFLIRKPGDIPSGVGRPIPAIPDSTKSKQI